MYENDDIKQKLVLVGIDDGSSGLDIDSSIAELKALAQTSGAEVVGSMIQRKQQADRALYLGKGKLEELKNYVDMVEADAVLCDDDLTPAQIRNMEKILGVQVMSRTLIILDIFAMRAQSAEGKVQVELAQLKYNLTHLTGKGKDMSRLGGGIGTRGPGEKKLETDKRIILNRITELNKQLKEIEHHRTVMRQQRMKNKIPVVALVGYTNAGKSTLLNLLTDAEVLSEDKLFATLDTTTRKFKVNSGAEYLLTDTVGFIRKLPHGLVKAFRATLEEAKYSDVLVHVVDASNENYSDQMDAVYDTLEQLNVTGKPIITLYNKMDRAQTEVPLKHDYKAEKTIMISAKTNVGIDTFKDELENVIKSLKKSIKVLIPYSMGKLLALIHGGCEIIEQTTEDEGYGFELYVDEEMHNRLKEYIVK